eukprot:4879742-Prymnesium_polylepis.1
MVVAYSPLAFWTICFSFRSGMLSQLPNGLLLLPVAIGVVCLEEYRPAGMHWGDADIQSIESVMLPFTLLVGLLTSFRVNDAYRKWSLATALVEELATGTKDVVTRLCSYCEPTQENQETILDIRRLLVLGCVLIEKHVRNEHELDAELDSGLITLAEHEQMTVISVTTSVNTGKMDRFPSKNRPAFAFYHAHRRLAELARRKAIPAPPYHMALDSCVARMSAVFNDVEVLGTTILPLPYAQVSRFVTLAFLTVLPFALVADLKWLTIPLCFVANIVYFTIDRSAAIMETPFGSDINVRSMKFSR